MDSIKSYKKKYHIGMKKNLKSGRSLPVLYKEKKNVHAKYPYFLLKKYCGIGKTFGKYVVTSLKIKTKSILLIDHSQ